MEDDETIGQPISTQRPMRPEDYGTPAGANWPAAVLAGLVTIATVIAVLWSTT